MASVMYLHGIFRTGFDTYSASYTDITDRHTWNRVYYDGIWWDVDITSDILRTKNNQNLYSFCALESVSASDKYYYITKIY